MLKKQNYIFNPLADWAFIIAPPFVCLLVVFVFATYFMQHHEVEPIHWLLLVLMVDVSHVYSTLYRTYADPNMQEDHKKLLYGIPLVVWILGVLLYAWADIAFWRVLAYLAVFHFVRQQYGFFRIYARGEEWDKYHKVVSNVMIYAATLYPVVVWHLSGVRNFTWFVQNDFVLTERKALIPYATAVYLLIWTAYLYFEFKFYRRERFFNIPKNMILLGTALSWYFGIIYYNSDLIFTLLNVVSHGVPYMALVWMYGHKRISKVTVSSVQHLVFSTRGILIFVLLLVLLAFVEETLWDSLIWHDHPEYFGFNFAWGWELPSLVKVLLVPLLAVPQMTHYVLDGFIWKLKTDKSTLAAL